MFGIFINKVRKDGLKAIISLLEKEYNNTPKTRVGSSFRNQTLTVKSRKNDKIIKGNKISASGVSPKWVKSNVMSVEREKRKTQ